MCFPTKPLKAELQITSSAEPLGCRRPLAGRICCDVEGCLSVRLSRLPRGCRPAVKLVMRQMKKGCWGLEVMLLAPSLPLPHDGGGGSPRDLHPTSQGSMAALCFPHVLDWRSEGEVRAGPPSLGTIRFHFPVVA